MRIFPDLSPVELNRKNTTAGPPQTMKFQCYASDEYIFKVLEWGFLYKLDLKAETFSSGRRTCESIDETFSQEAP